MSYIQNTQFLLEFFSFAFPCWITNISFQFIRAIKDCFPKDHWLSKYNIDRFDFIFLDKKPLLGGGIRLTSFIPILILPVLFNFFLPETYTYYLLLTFSVFLGDLLGSFIKRRFNYKKGEYMPFIDHGDYVLCAGIIFTKLNFISLKVFLVTIIVTYIFHPIVCFVGYKLKIKKQIL